MTSSPIPLEVDDVTPEWLGEVLGAPVAGVEVVDRHSGTTGRARLALTYQEPTDAPRDVFVKLAPFDERQRRFVDAVGLGVAEARFYRDLARDVPVRVPATYYAAVGDDGRYIMVLEDLHARGCHFPSTHDRDIAQVAAGIVTELAHLHARYWDSPALSGDLAWVTEGHRQSFGGGAPFIAKALDRFADEMPPAFRHLAELYVAETPGIARLYETGAPTLAHGDPHLGNLFVDGARVGFLDWGMVMRRAGMWDVAYVLCNSVPTDVRRAHEHEWLRLYRDTLAHHGVALDGDTAWEQYRLFAVYSWSSATSTAAVGSRWQTEATGQGGMRRATAAIEDLESVSLLVSLLA